MVAGMSIGDNGGPPLDDDGPAKLRWVKVNVAELLEGIEELTLEQRGYYLTALFKMYARMGGIPADEREGAKVMRLDVRAFRRLRDHITGLGKFYVEDGLLKNSRVEHEIIDYVREHKRRQEAALLREQRKREMQKFSETSGELPADFSETSPRSSKEVRETSFGLGEEKTIKSKDAPPQPYHKATTNQNQEPEPEPLKRREVTPLPPALADRPREGEEQIGVGVYVNCDTVRFVGNGRTEVISLRAIEVQTAGLAVPRDEIKNMVVAAALQWSAEVQAGKSPKIPQRLDLHFGRCLTNNFHNQAIADVRKQRAAKPAAKSTGLNWCSAEGIEEAMREIQKSEGKR